MKKIFTLLVSCLLLSTMQAQSLREVIELSGKAMYQVSSNNDQSYAEVHQRPRHHGRSYYIGMSPEGFAAAKEIISDRYLDSSMLETAKDIAAWNSLSASQIREIAMMFTFDSTRLEFTKYAFGNCANPGEYFILYDVFTFNSSISELADYIRSSY